MKTISDGGKSALGVVAWHKIGAGLWLASSFWGFVQVRYSPKARYFLKRRRPGGYEALLPWDRLPDVAPRGTFATLLRARAFVERAVHDRLEAIAHHEAAHLLAAHRLGFDVEDLAAQLVAGEGDAAGRIGLCHFKGETVPSNGSPANRARVDEAVIVLLAGLAGNRILRDSYEAGAMYGHYDYKQARTLVEAITPDPVVRWHSGIWHHGAWGEGEATLHMKVLEMRAETLVAENWEVIKRLAAALLEQGFISAARARAIIANRHN